MKKNNSNNELDAFVNLLIPPSLVLLLIVTIIELFYGFSQGMSIFIDFFDLFVIIILITQ